MADKPHYVDIPQGPTRITHLLSLGPLGETIYGELTIAGVGSTRVKLVRSEDGTYTNPEPVVFRPTPESRARELLRRLGVTSPDPDSMTSGDLVELSSLIADHEGMRAVLRARGEMT